MGASRSSRYDMAREFGEVLGLEHELGSGSAGRVRASTTSPRSSSTGGASSGVEACCGSSPRAASFPGPFIPVAEATGLILPLGEFVLREACEQTARWQREGLLPETFVTWVNLSGKQLSAAGSARSCSATLAGRRPARGGLGLEVTETAIVVEGAAGDRARAELQQLHELGVRIAIDDFGTGFSSLGQLRRFPIDMIKVDRSFVQGVEHDAKDAAITANLVSLAHALGLVAIAEGIESDGQLASVAARLRPRPGLPVRPAGARGPDEAALCGRGHTHRPTGRCRGGLSRSRPAPPVASFARQRAGFVHQNGVLGWAAPPPGNCSGKPMEGNMRRVLVLSAALMAGVLASALLVAAQRGKAAKICNGNAAGITINAKLTVPGGRRARPHPRRDGEGRRQGARRSLLPGHRHDGPRRRQGPQGTDALHRGRLDRARRRNRRPHEPGLRLRRRDRRAHRRPAGVRPGDLVRQHRAG